MRHVVPRSLCLSFISCSARARVWYRAVDCGVAVKRFGYALDPLCVLACSLYALNRWWLAPHLGGGFLHGQFNDLLLIPAALPFALWLQRRLNPRPDDRAPRWSEIALHLVAWSVAAELAGPRIFARATADWRDVVAYAAGGTIAGFWWQGIPWL